MINSMRRETLVPVFLLHHYPYRETSLLLEVFSREEGRVGVVARGRRRGKANLLQPFTPLLMGWSGRGELMTMTEVEPNGELLRLSRQRLMSGFYLNELLLRLLRRDDPHPQLFDLYELTLQQLDYLDKNVAPEPALHSCLRLFEKGLLEEIGYGLVLEFEARTGAPVEPGRDYLYMPGQGPVLQDKELAGRTLKGASLLALAAGTFPGSRALQECKRLTRQVLDFYLGGRELHSRKLMLDMQRNLSGKE